MIINKAMSTKLYNQINKRKRISKLGFTASEFDNYCHTLNLFTGLDYDVDSYNAHDLAKFKVPKSFKSLVIPRKISLDEGTSFKDLRGNSYIEYTPKEYGFESVKALKPADFNVITECIFGSRKTEMENNVYTVSELNGAKALTNYKHRITELDKSKQFDDQYVLPNATPFIPIDFSVTFQFDNYYRISLDLMLDDWIEKALTNLTAEN